MKKIYASIFVVAAMGIAHSAVAELAVGIGFAGYLDPQKGLDPEGVVIPLISYSGDRWSYQISTLSYRLASFGDMQISAVATPRIQGYEEKDSPYLVGMEKRSSSLDGGISIEWQGFSISYLHDVLDKYNGEEVAIGFNKGFQFDELELMLGVGVSWQSVELANYYYGVRAGEASSVLVDGDVFVRDEYVLEEVVVVPKTNILMKYSLSSAVFLIFGAEVNFLPNAITDSPIIDSDYTWGVFTGVAYSF